MCGINAIFKKDSSRVDVEDLRKMCAVITHRGPDDAGYTLLNNERVGLGHVRLSIIDLSGGDQPLYNQDGSIAIVFNGEIYDYKKIREDLIAKGHKFRTHSDTEVIIYLYQEYGMDFVHHLNGEFAFIIWDERQKRLIAARDRNGVKPLFWHENEREILFSSEAKGIMALPRVPRAINPDCLTGTLFGSHPKSLSVFKNIRSVKPGHFFVVEANGTHREFPYWQPRFAIDKNLSYEDAKAKTRDLLTKAVHRRMIADVPVGTYLSGGLDSSLVCALVAGQSSNVTSFSIGFGGSSYDESDAARQIAKHFGARFETIDCTEEKMAGEYLKTLFHCEQPLANPNSVAKQMLSSLVHKSGYKVCITGEGADELFGGYAYFKMEKLWRMLEAGGEEAREAKLLMKKFKALESRSEGIMWNRGDKWKKVDRPYGYPNFFQMRFDEASKHVVHCLTPDVLAEATHKTPLALMLEEFPATELRQMDPYNATRTVTMNQLISYIIPTLGDRVEMANSVECRTPFLDKDLVDFALTLDPSHCLNIHELREKRVLREAFLDILPPVVAQVHKHPFLSPSWHSLVTTKPGQEIVKHYMSKQKIRDTGMFQWPWIRRLLFYWNWLPKSTGLWKRVDVIAGLILSSQILHSQFVENPIAIDPHFKIKDRSWGKQAQAAPLTV